MNYNKLKDIPKLALDQFKDPLNWMAFLTNASWHYKYSFNNQLLITAQRPDATAVTTMRAWNTKLNRYINTGAKRILIIENKDNQRVLSNVFDVSDTHLTNPDGFKFALWQHHPDNDDRLLEGLSHRYPNNTATCFEDYIVSTIGAAVTDMQADIESELQYQGNPEFQVLNSSDVITLLKNSITYQVLSRCGYDPQRFFTPSDFEAIAEITSFKMLAFLGEQINVVAKPLLIEIGKKIHEIEIENKKGELSNAQENKSTHESELSPERRFSQSESGSAHAGKSADRKVRDDERSVPEGKSTLDIDRVDLLRRDQYLSTRNRSDGETSPEPDRNGNANQTSRPRPEHAPTRMGEPHDDPSKTSGGDRTSGTDIHQIGLFSNTPPSPAIGGEPLTASSQQKSEQLIAAQNFRLRAEDFKEYSSRDKFKVNVRAIETLKQIEKEQRSATIDEQKILASYVGWGGIPQAFDETNVHWQQEFENLKNLLTQDEYTKARESTLNAHYTSPTVIKAMYNALSEMGFTAGNVLEPAMGSGHFFGMLPAHMRQSKLFGVEIDSLTCRIAKQLYPEANIFEGGFEKTDYHNNFFDVAIGNVPFGDYKVYDKAYQKENFLIHDYFFAKSLDKIRPGGVMAMITSKGTMDKKNPAVRQYLAKRAELIGAVRLPNNAFNHAGTEVTSDILFFKKRDRMTLGDEEWVHLDTDENGITMNAYFVSHPEMILGEMQNVSGRFGLETTCLPIKENDFGFELKTAMAQLSYHFPEDSIENILDDETGGDSLPADPAVDNYSYTLIDDKLYFRNNSIMTHINFPDKKDERIKGLIKLRDTVRCLIHLQLDDASIEMIKEKQAELNTLYDRYVNRNGHINSRGNKLAFEEDASYWLLCALEKLDDDGNYLGKSDIFTERTIQPISVVTSVETANEALLVSIGEKAKVDLDYMSGLCNKSKDAIVADLSGIIFHDPTLNTWVTADEYLSGNVRIKLEQARLIASENTAYQTNVSALEKAQPKDLEASEIEVHLGATWIPAHFIDQFIAETFKPSSYLIEHELIKTNYSHSSGNWEISGKNMDSYSNVLINSVYGTNRANAYRILERALNLKDMRIMDTISTPDGDRQVINREETILANQKQELIKEAFKDWVFKDHERRSHLVGTYNEMFNSTRPREFDGNHIILHGVSPDIQLRDYQKNAIARALYGGNTLLGHCVGAGKTYEMTAIAMESKYLGLCNKSMFVVPNHLVGQWGSEFLSLYPGANILVAQKKDFMPGNRKKFCSRIATGNYDAVILGHSQFEKIPLSKEFQASMFEKEIESILDAISEVKAANGERFTIKELEKKRKSLEAKLEKLNDKEKDNTVTFEELGVDRLFVDEAHSFKNLYLETKMQRVAGIGQSEAQKSTDMFFKCRYLDQLTNSKGIVFATGTPISNSISELYTMMRYLQYDRLKEAGLGHFDSWAGNFTQQVTAVELSPEGTGYRSKTRLARFYNLPELMSFFKEIADIQTPDMLNLPIPEVVYENIVIKPSSFQKDMLMELVSRAEAVRNRTVEPYEDNMLKITNDGRKLALDQRLINPLLPDSEDSKANRCVENAYKIWSNTHQEKSAQLLFCDLSTPHGDGCFNVYDDIKNKLIDKGVPEKEIAFIHDANTDAKKMTLFNKVRSGQVRFLLGSTPKMGAGTNVQDRLIALHHLDVPWKPSDIEQQEGRILRQGNMNPEVKIFRYITEETFDAYSWVRHEVA